MALGKRLPQRKARSIPSDGRRPDCRLARSATAGHESREDQERCSLSLYAASLEWSPHMTEIDGSPLPSGLVLHENETVILALRPSPGWVVLINEIVTLGLYAIWWKRTAFVLTNQRIIYRRGLFNTVERSLPVRFVQDATVITRWTGVSAVTLSTAGGTASFEQISPLAADSARTLKEAVMQAARAAWPSQSGTDATRTDFTDTLRKLADLRDKGVLTEEEFTRKKAEILANGSP